MVNPTYLTAKSTLYMLADAGMRRQKKVIAALGTQNELVQNRRKENGEKLPMPDSERAAHWRNSGYPDAARGRLAHI